MASGMQRLAELLRTKTAAPHALSLQLSQQIPGTPLVLRGGEIKEERLPGMQRWVDRDMIQRAYAGLSDGISPDELVADEGARGSVLYPAAGAGAAALAANSMGADLAQLAPSLGKHGPLAAVLASALAGGVAGGVYQHASAPKRERDMREAIVGAQRDMAQYPRHPGHAIPQNQKEQGSASAEVPTLLSSTSPGW